MIPDLPSTLSTMDQSRTASVISNEDEDDDPSNIIGRWTVGEHERFLQALTLFGRDWRKLAKHVGTRNNVQCRTHAQKHFKKQSGLRCDVTSVAKRSPIEARNPAQVDQAQHKDEVASSTSSCTDDDTEKDEAEPRQTSKTNKANRQAPVSTNSKPAAAQAVFPLRSVIMPPSGMRQQQHPCNSSLDLPAFSDGIMPQCSPPNLNVFLNSLPMLSNKTDTSRLPNAFPQLQQGHPYLPAHLLSASPLSLQPNMRLAQSMSPLMLGAMPFHHSFPSNHQDGGIPYAYVQPQQQMMMMAPPQHYRSAPGPYHQRSGFSQ